MESALKRKSWITLTIILAVIVAVLIVWLERTAPLGSVLQSTTDDAPGVRRDFSLADTLGQRVSLATYQGKWLLLFFGFTNCPDTCPTALLNMSATLTVMGDAARNVQPIFITIDPERDTPALLKDYLANFGDHIAGLSGTATETAAIAKAYGVYYHKEPIAGGEYVMDHSTAVYLISPTGIYVRPYVPDLDPDEFAKQLTEAMIRQPGASQ